eukprot:gnl/MRDRNA2_/MRDRNA2_85065_c0_seq4.p1 gnl/MRDRNA2_/MRDRNA2_85065_c0~~gnl/MRDRNA2_/MRDRNA2_85065_c0_seq4.p1  ORF type:complete len:4104 (-),score=817.24 gnl/MRDRNA2_/MRDRNA2_85065_c0_seq4:76-11610(-)
MSLAEWMHQSLMYSVLTSMAFFKYYIHRKVFGRWQRHARYAMYCHHRQRLSQSCFFAKPLFVEPLVKMHALMTEVSEIRVMTITNNVYQLTEFAETQATVRANPVSGGVKDFEQKHDAVVMTLDQLVAVVNRSTELEVPSDSKAETGKSKSMVQEKQEARERARRQRVAKRDAAMLGDCIRLVDYMFQASLVTVVSRAAAELEARCEARNKLFSIAVWFGETNMTLDPQKELFADTMNQLWDGTLHVVNQVPSFTSVRQYEPYVRVGNHMPVKQVLAMHQPYTASVDRIWEVICEDIDATQKYADETFEHYRRIHDYGRNFDGEAYLEREIEHDELAGEMMTMREFQDDIEKFRPHHVLGIMAVDGKGLKNDLIPVPDNALDVMKEVLKKQFRDKCDVAFERFDRVNKALDERPAQLSKYAEYVKMYAQVQEEASEMEEVKEEVEQMYQLLRNYNCKVKLEDQMQLDTLQIKAHDFTHKKILEANVHIMEQKQLMIDDCTAKSQRVEEEMKGLAEEVSKGIFIDEEAIPNAHEVLDELDKIGENLRKHDERAGTFAEYEDLFGIPGEPQPGQEAEGFQFVELENTKKLFNEKLKLWETVAQWQDFTRTWHTSDFLKLDVELMNKQVSQSYRTCYQLAKNLEGDAVVTRIKSMVEEWKGHMATILDLGNPAMRPRHWEKIYKAINLPWKGPASASSISLHTLEMNGIFDHKELVSEISGTASGEFALEQSLDKVIDQWQDMPMPVMNHRNQKDLWIMGDISEIITQCEDHSVTIATMMGSRFIVGIRDKVEVWERKVNLCADTIDEWLQVQRAWMYLENIFSAEDIQRQLPGEAAKFKQVDKFWKDLFRKVRQSARNVMDAVHIPNLLTQLKWANDTLDQIQKSLEKYLETKRAAFPRFYFLSNDELLSILSQTRNPHAVQEHLCKCFDSINRVIFSETKPSEILAMSDMIKECVDFAEPVETSGVAVEFWLGKIEEQMVAGLYQSSRRAFMAYPDDGITRKDWLFGPWASQSVLMVDQIFWTKLAEEALNKIETGENPKAMQDNIDFTAEQRNHSVSLVRLNLTKLQRVLMGALIVLDVHGIAVLNNLLNANTSSVNDFDWSKQLRYYWILEGEMQMSAGQMLTDDCACCQTIASFPYSHEYLGNTPRLVVTPLTDKCYMTLTGAMHLNYGGAPAGPAGTGKTETTKDLGKALAVPVVVFNCSDGLDYKIMGRFFSGLAQAGAWACFDEFNRIQVEVLSVIAQQMLTITQAIRGKKELFEFLGREIPLNTRFGVYITMNPGYAGRAELPDNLKSLFRPVAMMVPDYGLIAEIILYSEGFQGATTCARKMVNLYRLSSEQLSKQDHYDFGMRAVKSVLVMAGQLKRKYPDLHEDITLIRALRDSNVPKFLSFDLPLFSGIISDLYPGVVVPFSDYGSLMTEIENQLRKASLQIVPAFVQKITQLLETQLVRHGVMLVGLSMTGKSTDSNILSKALTQLKKDGSDDPVHQLTKIYFLNPKSITMQELYGSFNENTGEWSDGLVAILVREAVSDTSDNKKWVNFDGPVDAIWIENMNTVLDDNKMLCLSNGERIKLPPTMTMMFEVNDLAVASPATVSRCGMVYLEPVHLGWTPLIESWAEIFMTSYPKYTENLQKWTTQVCTEVLPFIREECKEAPGIPSMDNNLVTSYLRMLSTFINKRHNLYPEGDGKPPVTEDQADQLVRMYCAFAAIWSLGANIHEASRKQFCDFLRPRLLEFCPSLPDLDLFSICVDDNAVQFIELRSIVQEFKFDTNQAFFEILVPTAETTGQRLLLENLMNSGYHCLFSGETGVGKSVGIQQFLNTAGESYSVATANFSAQTNSGNVVDLFENRLERKRKNLLGAPPGTIMLFFVDDINMPMLEFYGAQPPIELLRQVVDYGGFYDRKKLFWKNVADTQFIAACGPPGGGRMPVTPRLFRHFNMIWMTALSSEAMNRILSSILGGWLGEVKQDLQPLAVPIIQSTVEMFFKITNDLLPTPAKCHYTFNLRDPAKMVQGMLMINVKKGLKSESDLYELFMHETARQFRDRLINDTDRAWFNRVITTKLKENAKATYDPDIVNNLVFGDFFDRAEKPYLKIEDEAKMISTFQEFLDDYNVSYPSTMNLVFFKDACLHLVRCARVLRQPRGNLLLVGVSGVGRKSMSRVAAHISEYSTYAIEITRSYGPNEFREDIKTMMFTVMKNGGKGLSFLFSDTQIVKESFLEDINNILNTGEVPNLFAPDETEQVIGLTRPLAKAAGKPEQRDVILAHFVMTIRENLHIVLAFSPVGEGFRARCRQFPSIINCATIDWYNPWPADALYSVAERYYKEAPADLGLGPMLSQLSQMSCTIHSTVSDEAEVFFEALRRRTYTTPTSYLELIKLFMDLLKLKQGEVTTKLNRYKVGSKTLSETKDVVDKLKSDLTKMQPVIEQAKKDTAALMEQVTKDQAIAEEKKAACAVDEKNASEAAFTANEIKADCQKDLDEALPEFYSAIKSLDALDKKDIQEIKSFAKPPPLVEVVLSAVCLLLGKKESWDDAKKLMNDSNFLPNLKNYDKEALASNTKLLGKLSKYIKRDDFVPDKVKSVSNAAMSLCLWVRAMDVYSRVAREIEPKKQKLASAEAALAEADGKLAVARAELKEVMDKVAMLEQQLAAAKAKSEQLVRDADDCVVKLDRAEKLLLGLGNESVRWIAASEVLEKALKYIVGNIMLAGGFISYIGAFTAEYRKKMVDCWVQKSAEIELNADPGWNCAEVLVDPAEVRTWNIHGLPADDLSIENGIMVTRGRRWPLMIDPQAQANRWVRNMGAERKVGIIKLTDPNFLRTLENGIRYGNPILLENVEEVLDPALEPVLLKQFFKSGGQICIRLGTEDVPYSDDFQFFITTKMANPHYLPEICIKVTVINFTVTLKGLEDQLVIEVVANERPDLSTKRQELVVQIAADKSEMDRLEQLILRLLAEAEGDVLSDDKLIVTLDQSKKTGDECKERMEVAENAMVEIDECTEMLRPVATRASILYFVVADLGVIDPMYQYSLEFFVSLIKMRLANSEQNENSTERIKILLADFTSFMYINICRGLFEDHKLLYSFLITAQILRNQGHAEYIKQPNIAPNEWLFFLRGLEAGKGLLSDDDYVPEDPPSCIEAVPWSKIDTLERIGNLTGDTFKGLCAAIKDDPKWADFIGDDLMYTKPLPGSWATRFSKFQELLIIKSLRENFLSYAIKNFVGTELGKLFIESPPFDLMGCFNDSVCTTPLIFILSAGADPTDYLLKLAKDKGYTERLHFISLGQGQGPKAERLINLGRESGDWVCLQNCHLATSWMGALERIQEAQDPNKIDPDYRLWLTSMPSPAFPVPVLQGGIKITNEPPKGVRANLMRTFAEIDDVVYGACQVKPREYKKLLFALAFFHAVILERRKFGPIGWNIPYEWMDSDFQVSREQVGMYLESQPGVPWVTLNYIIAEVNYGGRVTDDKDVRLISAILVRYFNQNVLTDRYTFSALPEYYAPDDGELEPCREYCKNLPMEDDPQVFGLHPNALITAQVTQAKRFLDTVMKVQPRISSGGGGKKPEDLVAEMAEEFLRRVQELPKKKMAHAETYKPTEEGGVISIGVFHGQEYDRFISLVGTVRSTLVTMGKAIKGLVVMSAAIEDMYNSFLLQRVPGNWSKVAYPCLKPLNSWVTDFILRLEFMSGWLTEGPPLSFWLPVFFFPQGFMTASMQLHARKTRLPIDTLAFSTKLRDYSDHSQITEAPDNGVNVHGVFIQGCGWDFPGGVLAESDKLVLFVLLPVIWLEPILLEQQAERNKGKYQCPLYKTSERKGTLSTTGHSTNFVMYMFIPTTTEDLGHWIRRGVALLLLLDD